MNIKRTFIFSIIVAGATTIAAQIISFRNLFVVAGGSELSIGIIFASWLLWSAFASIVFGRISDIVKDRTLLFSICQFALFFVLPLTFVFIRCSRTLLNIAPGEIIGYVPTFIISAMTLFLPCMIMGIMFPLACKMYQAVSNNSSESITRVYVFEAIGAILGGGLIGSILVAILAPLTLIFGLAVLNICGSMLMLKHSKSEKTKRFFLALTGLSLACGLIFCILGGQAKLEQFSRSHLWKNHHVVASTNSVYGNITLTKDDNTLSFYENGLLLYTIPDRLSSEMAVHFAMLENLHPNNVLLIGGGAGGLLKEILKYNPESIDYVELDPTIVTLAKQALPAEDSVDLDHPAVHIINADGRYYVKHTSQKYDVVIINLGDPYTEQLSRFYTVEFFEELSKTLNPGAVVSFAVTSSANFVSKELKDYLSSLYHTTITVFPDVKIIPGETAYFIASNVPNTLTLNVEVLLERLSSRSIKTEYVRDYYLFDLLSADRIHYIKDRIQTPPYASVNRDFKPITYYLATVFWGTQFESGIFSNILTILTPATLYGSTIVFCLLILVFCMFTRHNRRYRVFLAVMTTGMAEMSFQLAIILAFQVIYGYLFYKIGLIITSFMIGLAIGGFSSGKIIPRLQKPFKFFITLQCLIVLYPLLVRPFFLSLASSQSKSMSGVGANLACTLLPIIAGLIGGLQFPLANKIYLDEVSDGGTHTGKISGASYGFDLLGACLGALFAATIFIPILGFFPTCMIISFINLTVLVGLLLKTKT